MTELANAYIDLNERANTLMRTLNVRRFVTNFSGLLSLSP